MLQDKTILDQTIRELQAGSKQAFEVIYNNYSPALFGVLCKMLPREKAEDILQDAFVKIWKKAKFYDMNKGSFYTWMLNICRNAALDELRKLKVRGDYNIQKQAENVGTSADLSMESKTNTIGLSKVLGNLSQEQRQAIEYLYYKGFTQKEMSESLNIPFGTVKSRARMALQQLHKLLKREG